MTRRRIALMLAGLTLAASAVLIVQGVPTVFSSSNYYILSLGQVDLNVSAVIQAAQSAGYTLATFEGDSVTVDRGPLGSTSALADALDDPLLLIVDANRIHLASRRASYDYTVRPSEAGYELVIAPHASLPVQDTLAEALMELMELGVIGSEVTLQFETYRRDEMKGPPPPADVSIETPLYQLTVAEDWFRFAANNHLTLVGLRVSVVAEVLPGESLDPSFASFVEREGDSLVGLVLPIDRLLALARSSAVRYVNTPRQPFVP